MSEPIKDGETLPENTEFQDVGAQILNDEHFADEQPQPEAEAPAPVVITDGMSAKAIEAMLKVAENMGRIVERQEQTRQVPYNEVKPVSSFNPTGDRNHPKFSRATYMDGILLNSLQHFPEEVRLFNQLKPGRYCDRKIEVRKGASGEIDLVRLGGKIDQRMERTGKFPTLLSMLTAIVAERKEKEERKRKGLFEDEDVL